MFITMDANSYEKAKHGFDPSLLERAMHLKMEVVEKDERETGLRAVLNFGHSIGHALEKLSDYSIPHGYAVALGMLVEARASVELGLLDEKVWKDLSETLQKLGVEANALQRFAFDPIWSALQNDKKNREGEVRWVQLKKIGETTLESITKEVAEKAWHTVLSLH